MGSVISYFLDNGETVNKMENKMENKIPSIILGQCKFCAKKQIEFGKDGYWIFGDYWICLKCKEDQNIKSYPVACEWCNYQDVKWHQGHTYSCPRCIQLNISHHGF